MSRPCAQPLDYETPPLKRRFDPAAWPPIPLLVAVVVFSAFLTRTGGKIVPGGPFISLHADVAPAVLSIAVAAFGWRSLRHGPPWRRFVLALLVLSAVAILFLVLDTVILFWLRPYARGDLVSW
jgi:hypothetical protein